MAADPANQLSISGNACGPTALLNALRFGSADYQQAAAAIPGSTDRSKLHHVITRYGNRWSQHIPQRRRWSRRGINAADLTDVACELAGPAPSVRMIIPQDPRVIEHSYQAVARSLRRGFPPIAGIRRYDGAKTIESHFITIIQVPDTLAPGAQEFSIHYIDPMGGKQCQGMIRARQRETFTELTAELPQTPIGAARASASSYLKMDSIIVR